MYVYSLSILFYFIVPDNKKIITYKFLQKCIFSRRHHQTIVDRLIIRLRFVLKVVEKHKSTYYCLSCYFVIGI